MIVDTREYFRNLRLAAQEIVIEPPTTSVLERMVMPLDAASVAIRKMGERLVAVGWDVQLAFSRTHTTAEYRANDSERKPGQEAPEHRRGDLRKEAHDTTHWWLSAAFPPLRLGMTAHWVEGVTPKGARSFGLQEACCRDPVGMPLENWVDYQPDANALKQAKDEPKWAYEARVARLLQDAARMDAEYNKPYPWLTFRPTFTKAGDLELWLQEAIEMTERVTPVAA